MSDIEIESQGKEGDRDYIIVKGDGPPESRKFYFTLEQIENIKARNAAYGEMWRQSRYHQLKAAGIKTQADEEILEENRKRELVQKKPPEVAEQNAIDEMKAAQKAREKQQ